ncbi:MAG TPA: TRAP transporter small permease [Xanthobacteraceae bacterium]|nr:TRAP transporter small permease [Xanthobacteraceae bacterium]
MAHGIEIVEVATSAPPVVYAGPVDRVLAAVNHAVVVVSSVALVIAAAVLSYSVFARYFLHVPTDWQDELSVFLIVGAVFMSGAAVQVRRGHIGIEAVVAIMSTRVNAVRQVLVDLASFLFCAFFAWKSFTLLHEALVEGYHSTTTWEAPLWIPYSLMAVGMSLLSIQILAQVTAALVGRRARP